jgi:hypothetical protein
MKQMCSAEDFSDNCGGNELAVSLPEKTCSAASRAGARASRCAHDRNYLLISFYGTPGIHMRSTNMPTKCQ